MNNLPIGSDTKDAPWNEHMCEIGSHIEYPLELCKICCLPVDCQKENVKPICEEENK